MTLHVISLATATQRRSRFQERAQRLGLEFEFFDAIEPGWNPSSVPPDFLPAITLGEAGCFLSHRAVWELAAKRSEPTIICEDDCYLYRAPTPDDYPPAGVDLVFLNARINAGNQDSFEGRFRNPVHGCGLEAYIVTPAGAAKLLSISATVTKPIDLRVIAHIESFEAAGHSCCNAEFWEPTAPDVRLSALRLCPAIAAHLDYGHSTIHDGVAA